MKQLPLSLGPALRKRRRRAARTGPKPRDERAGFVPHRTRAVHDYRHPVHVTIRRVRLAPSFRAERISAAIVHELAIARSKGVRVVEHSIQDDHLHLMIEGQSADDLSAQMRKLFSRIAMAVNQTAGRHGSLFRDRHHRHALKSPREVRNALVYIIFNARKQRAGHAADDQALFDAPDPLSSAPWFHDWAENARPPPEAVLAAQRGLSESPLAAKRTWLDRWLEAQ